MSAQVAKLEQLLSRVQKRAQEPRSALLNAVSTDSVSLVGRDEPAVDGEPAVEAGRPEMVAAEVGGLSVEEPKVVIENAAEVGGVDELDEPDGVVIDELDEIDFDETLPESGAVEVAASAGPITPPPESGEELTDLHIPADDGPTMEQLGETIPLEEGKAQHLELDEPVLDGQASVSSGPLEVEIPASNKVEELQVPASAREDLERVRLGEPVSIEARVSIRPVLSTNVVEFVSSAKEFEPESFLGLLDASLSLK